MRDAFDTLLDAVICHLEDLQSRGVRYVPVSVPTLAGLTRPPPTAVRSARAPAAPAAPPAVSKPPPAARADDSRGPAGPEVSLALPLDAPNAAARPALSPEAKAAAFAELSQRVMPCVKCPRLASARKNVVFGVGDINARLMFVGEAPGADEDEQGEPFVGRAGQLLTKIIEAMGLSRGSVYIANILKCRPDTPGQRTGNRAPTPAEMETCLPYLQEQIDIIHPEAIVALGATAVLGLLGKKPSISSFRGHWQTYRAIPLMPTYHPAYLLRNQGRAIKRQVWEDMLQVMERLRLPITQKQRNYFRG